MFFAIMKCATIFLFRVYLIIGTKYSCCAKTTTQDMTIHARPFTWINEMWSETGQCQSHFKSICYICRPCNYVPTLSILQCLLPWAFRNNSWLIISITSPDISWYQANRKDIRTTKAITNKATQPKVQINHYQHCHISN